MIRMGPMPRITAKRRRKARIQMLTVRRFQYHYAFLLVSFGFIVSLLVGGGTIYLLSHNYHLFMRAGLLTAPGVVDNLDRELKLATELIIAAFFGFVILLGVFGVRFTHSIVVPVYLIQEKMRQLSRGDLSDATIRIRQTDEFQEFAETYNYLVESLRAQAENDVKRLCELKPDEHNRDAIHIWKTMIQEKESQLTGGETVSPVPADVSRHAS